MLKESYKYIQYELTSDSTSPVTNVQIFEPTILSKLVTTDDVNIRQTHDNVIAWVPDDGVYDTTELYTAASSSTNKPPPAIFFDCEPRFVLQYSDKTIVQFLDGRTFNYENTKTVQSRFDTSIEADPAFGILDSLPKPTHAGWIDTRVCPEDVK